MRLFSVLLTVALGLAACSTAVPFQAPGPLPEGCSLTQMASVALTNERNFMLAPVSLNGRVQTMVVDTGAEVSTLTPAGVARLGLDPNAGPARVLHGVGGDTVTHKVRVSEMALGGVVVRRDVGLDVSDLPPFPNISPPVSGLLGADILGNYDVVLDLPAGRMVLYTAAGCRRFQPWPNAVAVPVRRIRSGLLFTDAIIDGRRVRALIDSGARTTLVRRSTALTLGVTEASLASDRQQSGMGVGNKGLALRQHRFEQLGVPGDLIGGATVDIAELRLPGVEMLLGADFLGARHVWLSPANGLMFLRR